VMKRSVRRRTSPSPTKSRSCSACFRLAARDFCAPSRQPRRGIRVRFGGIEIRSRARGSRKSDFRRVFGGVWLNDLHVVVILSKAIRNV